MLKKYTSLTHYVRLVLRGLEMHEDFFEICKICSIFAAKISRAGELKCRNFIFEKPIGTHLGVCHSTGDFTFFVYRKGVRGICGQVSPLTDRPGWERIPGFYRVEGAGIKKKLHKIPVSPSLCYDILAKCLQVSPVVIFSFFELREFQKTKAKKTGCESFTPIIPSVTNFEVIQNKKFIMSENVLQKAA